MEQDSFRRFIFVDHGIRGEWVRLEDSFRAILDKHEYVPVVQNYLGEALAGVTLLSATIKFTGAMILQAQTDGPLRTLVAQCTNKRRIRGIARYDDQALNRLADTESQHVLGQGRLVITIKSENAEPYQGVVSLGGNTLAQAIENYFTQSEQLHTRIWLHENEGRAAGLLLQELPTKGHDEEAWERLVILADTLQGEELLTLSCEELLYRLFHEEQVKLFDSERVVFSCSCSSEKIAATLVNMGRSTLEEILQVHELITVDCEFCNQKYTFDRAEIDNLFNADENPT